MYVIFLTELGLSPLMYEYKFHSVYRVCGVSDRTWPLSLLPLIFLSAFLSLYNLAKINEVEAFGLDQSLEGASSDGNG